MAQVGSACSTGSYTSCHVVVTDGDSYRMKQARAKEEPKSTTTKKHPKTGDFHLATSGDHELAIDTRRGLYRSRRTGSAAAARTAVRSARATMVAATTSGTFLTAQAQHDVISRSSQAASEARRAAALRQCAVRRRREDNVPALICSVPRGSLADKPL